MIQMPIRNVRIVFSVSRKSMKKKESRVGGQKK